MDSDCACVCRFADTEVRRVAVSWIEKSSDDELAGYLPQLVQVEPKYLTDTFNSHIASSYDS